MNEAPAPLPADEQARLLWTVYRARRLLKERPEAKELLTRKPANREEVAQKELLLDAQEARNILVERNLRLVHAVANRYARVAEEMGVDYQDLVQSGVVGLIEAMETYDPKVAQFSTWAYHRIRYRVQEVFSRERRRAIQISLEEPLHDHEDLVFGDTLESARPRPEEVLEAKLDREEARRALEDHLDPTTLRILLESERPERLLRALLR